MKWQANDGQPQLAPQQDTIDCLQTSRAIWPSHQKLKEEDAKREVENLLKTRYRCWHYFYSDQLKRIVDSASELPDYVLILLGNYLRRFLLDDMTITANWKKWACDDVKCIIQGTKAHDDPNDCTTYAVEWQNYPYAKSMGYRSHPVLSTVQVTWMLCWLLWKNCIKNLVPTSLTKVSKTTMDLRKWRRMNFVKSLIGKYMTSLFGR